MEHAWTTLCLTRKKILQVDKYKMNVFLGFHDGQTKRSCAYLITDLITNMAKENNNHSLSQSQL